MNEKRSKVMRDFLLSFFPEEKGYSEREVNGFYLIKQFSRNIKLWTVAIFTSDDYRNRKRHAEQFRNSFKSKPRGNSVSENK